MVEMVVFLSHVGLGEKVGQFPFEWRKSKLGKSEKLTTPGLSLAMLGNVSSWLVQMLMLMLILM